MRKIKIIFVYLRGWDILRTRRMLTGQTMIESTFSTIVIVMLMLGMVKVFFWVGSDLAGRRVAHETTLISPVNMDINDNYRQIRPAFYEGQPMDASTINSEIFGPNRLP